MATPTPENNNATASRTDKAVVCDALVSLPKLRLLAVMWAGRKEPAALQCAKELTRVILPHLNEKECAEIEAAFLANGVHEPTARQTRENPKP